MSDGGRSRYRASSSKSQPTEKHRDRRETGSVDRRMWQETWVTCMQRLCLPKTGRRWAGTADLPLVLCGSSPGNVKHVLQSTSRIRQFRSVWLSEIQGAIGSSGSLRSRPFLLSIETSDLFPVMAGRPSKVPSIKRDTSSSTLGLGSAIAQS